MNLAAVDLNLLVALEALLAEGSVGRAADRVGLSQPAMSHALRRLRDLVDDPLMVRVGAGMELTPRAEALRAPLGEALANLRGVFLPAPFDPATSTRRFILMMPDLVAEQVLPPLIERTAEAAPRVRFDVAPWRNPETMSEAFRRELDLALACIGDAFDGFHRQRLYTDSDMLAVRRGHPLGARLSRLDVFKKARHVAIISAERKEDYIDEWLRKQGVERDIALAVPHYLLALRIAAATDLVAFLPSRMIRFNRAQFALQMIRPPLDPGEDEQFLFYPVRAQVDPASIWLRQQILAIGRALDKKNMKAA